MVINKIHFILQTRSNYKRCNMKHKVITLCGSIKFQDDFLRVQHELTIQGNIVLLPVFLNNINTSIDITKLKPMLNEMHLQKIDMSDEIFVVNRGGYIGDSTKHEIEYAKSKNKNVKYMVYPDIQD